VDKVKAFARAAWRQNFWIGCGLILVVTMASWLVASKTLEDEFEENESKINSQFQTVGTLISKVNPPTEKSHTKMDQLLARTLKSVENAWLQQYSDQQRILVWDPRLKPDFISKVRPLKPIELKVDFPTPPESELAPDLLQRYANYVDNLLPILAQTIGTDWQVGRTLSTTPEGTPTRPARPTERVQPLVVWDQSDQARLVGTHFNWSSQPDGAPTTLQMLYAQEDLWVYQALMHIIRQTNGDIESRHEGVVKTIETILIGRGAIGKAGQVTRLGGQTMGGYGGEMGGGYDSYESESEEGNYGEESSMGMGGMGMGGMEMGMGMGGMGMGDEMGEEMGGDYGEYGGGMGSAMSRDPGDMRYVDNNYSPLPASRLREALRSGGPEDAFLVVAKRMPVRLRLIVDQRKLPRLLAEFGNSPLPVEVRQVRVNRQGGATGGGYGGDMGGYGGGYGEMGGMGGFGGEMGGVAGEMGSYGGDYGEEAGGYGGEMGGGYGGDYGEEMGGYGEEMGGYGAGGYGMAGGNMNSRTKVSSTSKHDVPVDIYGIIYIYNPVDKEKLGQEQAPALTGPTADSSSNPMG
jgi:hypothetical protein